jgi:hypothetical protein
MSALVNPIRKAGARCAAPTYVRLARRIKLAVSHTFAHARGYTRERTRLKPVDHAAVFSALDQPPAPTDTLRAAFARQRTPPANG